MWWMHIIEEARGEYSMPAGTADANHDTTSSAEQAMVYPAANLPVCDLSISTTTSSTLDIIYPIYL